MLTYEIESNARIVVIRGADSEPPDRLRFLESLMADPRLPAGFAILRDRRGQPALATHQIRIDLTFVASFPALQRSRWALLIDDPADVGYVRWASALATVDDIRIQAFLDEGDARRWLAEWRMEPTGESLGDSP